MPPYPAAVMQHSGDHSDLQHAGVSLHSETKFGVNTSCCMQCLMPRISCNFILAMKWNFQNTQERSAGYNHCLAGIFQRTYKELTQNVSENKAL
jgi:hypothetical protein